MNKNNYLESPAQRNHRKGAALYISVLLVALISSLLGLAGLTVVRIERQKFNAGSDFLVARANAKSAVELAIIRINNDPNWRTTYTNNVESSLLSLGNGGVGTVSWILTDSDGDLSAPDTDLQLKGIGRVGENVQVIGVTFELKGDAIAAELRTFTYTSNLESKTLTADAWWGQYLKPNLPPEAVAWWISSIDLYINRQDNKMSFDVKIYKRSKSPLPGATILDSVTKNSSDFSKNMDWQTITFSGEYKIKATDGVTIALETNAKEDVIDIGYSELNAEEVDSAMIGGDPIWKNISVKNSMLYKVNGFYITDDGSMEPVKGSWKRDAAP